jgi:membrane protease subunit (stomatin/prohibitin family)
MALMDFIKKQFIDVLQWTEAGTVRWRGVTRWPTWKSRMARA